MLVEVPMDELIVVNIYRVVLSLYICLGFFLTFY